MLGEEIGLLETRLLPGGSLAASVLSQLAQQPCPLLALCSAASISNTPKPQQIAREAAKKRSIEMGIEDIDRARPIADPQDTGLIKGRGAVAKAAQQQQVMGAEAAAAGGQQQQKS
jgi:hypothetical protein